MVPNDLSENENQTRASVDPSQGESPRPSLPDALEMASDMLAKYASEIRMIIDRLRFVGVEPEQQEFLVQEVEAVKKELAALVALTTEIRNSRKR